MTGNEPQPERPVDQPPYPGQPGHEPYALPGGAQQPGYPQYDPSAYGPPPGYDQYGQPIYPAYPTYPTYPTYSGYTVYPYPPPYPYAPPDTKVRGQAIAALVTNIVVSLLCCPLIGIAGIVLSAIAMSRSDHDPESARKLVKWSWGALAAAVVVGIAMFVLLIVFTPEES